MMKKKKKVQLKGLFEGIREKHILKDERTLIRWSLVVTDYLSNFNTGSSMHVTKYNICSLDKTAEFIEKNMFLGLEVAVEGYTIHEIYIDQNDFPIELHDLMVDDLLIAGNQTIID